jgi:hypothetical protein
MRSVVLGSGLVIGIAAVLGLTGCNGGTGSSGSDGAGGKGPGGTAGPSTGSGEGTSCAAVAGNLPLGSKGTTPSVVWGGSAFAVAWQSTDADEGDIQVAMVDTSGKMLSQSAVTTSALKSAVPVIAKSGDGLVVVWRDSDGAIRGRKLDGGGAPQGAEFELSANGNPDARPGLAATSAGVAVGWGDTGQAFVGLVGDGTMSNKTALPGATFPALAGAGADVGLAWSDGGSIQFSKVTAQNLTPGAPVAHEATAQNLAMAAGDDHFLVVWEDTRSGEEEIYITFADDPAGTQIVVESEGGSANWPTVAWNGDQAAVAYYQFRDGPPRIYLSLVDANLAHVGADLEVTEQAARFPSIAWSGDHFGLAWAVKDGGVQMTIVDCH